MNVILFGIKGCGKTTLGKKIAKKLDRAFIDTDALIEELFQVQHGQKISCRAIFQEVGAEGFRALEYEAIQSLQDVQHSVIAVGGGAMVLMENVEALAKNGELFYLICEKEVLKKRVLSAENLPVFLDLNDPDTSFERMYDERDEIYRNLGANQINITNMKDTDAINTICKKFDALSKKKKKHG